MTAVTRTTLYDIIHDRFSELATEAGWLAGDTDYGKPLDNALRLLGLSTTSTSLELSNKQLVDVIDVATINAADKLKGYWILRVDVELGPRKEKLGEIVKMIDSLKPRPVIIRTDVTPTFTDFNLASGVATSWPVNWFEAGRLGENW